MHSFAYLTIVKYYWYTMTMNEIVTGLLMALVTMGGYHRWRSATGERLDRSEEGWALLLGIRLAGLTLLGAIAAWVWEPRWFTAWRLPIPQVMAWAGVALLAGSVLWLGWMFGALGRNLTDTVVTRRAATLVRTGPYAWVRNPMYVGLLGLAIGLGLATQVWLFALGGVLVFTLLAIRTRTEERFLLARFPEDYGQYMREVNRFIPRPR